MPRYTMYTEQNDDTGSQVITVSPRTSRKTIAKPRLDRPDIVLVIGGTGTGKSSFVSAVSGKAVGIGHDLRSFTSSCQAVDLTLGGRHAVQLVDTPGFNDTTRSDLDILSSIAGWLQVNKAAIAGIVFLHRISEKRYTGAHRMMLQILQSMCGQHFLPHLVLCTTMWDTIPNKEVRSEAEARESEMIGSDELWSPLLTRGAMYMRFTGDHASGVSIVEAILEYPARAPMELQLQLRSPKCEVEDTYAGHIITAEMRKKEERLRKERLEEEAEERELREQVRHEREALQQEEQKNRRQEASFFRRTDGKSSDSARHDRRFRDSRDGKSKVSDMTSGLSGLLRR